MSRYKELGTPRSEFHGICRKAWAGPDIVFLKVGSWLTAWIHTVWPVNASKLLDANTRFPSLCVSRIPSLGRYNQHLTTPPIRSQDKPKYNSTRGTNELIGLDYRVWLRGCCQEHRVLQAATLGNLHPTWMAAPHRHRAGAPSVTLPQITSSSTSWRWWAHVQLGQNCISGCGSRGWSVSGVQWSSPPLLLWGSARSGRLTEDGVLQAGTADRWWRQLLYSAPLPYPETLYAVPRGLCMTGSQCGCRY